MVLATCNVTWMVLTYYTLIIPNLSYSIHIHIYLMPDSSTYTILILNLSSVYYTSTLVLLCV